MTILKFHDLSRFSMTARTLLLIIITIHSFYKAPFKALKVAVQHIKNSSRMDTIKKAVCSRATITGNKLDIGRPER